MFACGENQSGQLGLGSTKTTGVRKIKSLPPIASIVQTRGKHSIFLDANGTAFCCGSNKSGQLGLGTSFKDQPLPVKIPHGSHFVGGCCGPSQSFLIDNNNSVWCTGSNFNGVLGVPRDGGNIYNFTKIDTLPDIVSVSSSNHTLFLDCHGVVWGCGANDLGQLGPDLPKRVEGSPVQLANLPKITEIAAAESHSLFLDENGGVWGCGEANRPLNSASEDPIVKLDIPFPVKAISFAHRHGLLLNFDGGVWSFGLGPLGVLGYYTDEREKWVWRRPTPVLTNLPPIKAIGAGYDHSLFIDNTNSVWSCGSNQGQLGTSNMRQPSFRSVSNNTRIRLKDTSIAKIPTKSARKVYQSEIIEGSAS